MNALQLRIHEAILQTKAAAEEIERKSSKLDPVWTELATAFGCLGRARRLLLERPEVEQ